MYFRQFIRLSSIIICVIVLLSGSRGENHTKFISEVQNVTATVGDAMTKLKCVISVPIGEVRPML